MHMEISLKNHEDTSIIRPKNVKKQLFPELSGSHLAVQLQVKRREIMEKTMEKIVALAKARGFVYPGSEIYGGLANTWDYGNLGVELKNNVKRAWWQKFIQESPYNVGVDCAILMNPQTWIASGHLGGFSDPLMDCKECHERFRADKLIEDFCAEHDIAIEGSVDAWSQEKMMDFIKEHEVGCPSCGKHNFTDIRQFNLMFKTFQGVTEDAKNTVYLRPETAQGIFVNFKNVQRTSRKKIPFGIGQIGKSFRNEITPGNFTFRTREFEQMELEFFCEPDTDLEWFAYWKKFCLDWLSALGLKDDEVRYRDHDKEELSFYSKATTDVEFLFPFGWGELWGIADRTDYDLTQHQNVSGQDLTYFDDEKKQKYIPYVIEPSLGADRMYLLSSAALTMRKFWMKRRTMSVQSFISIRYLHRLRSVCFRFPRSLTRVLRRSTSSFPRSTIVSTMTVEISVNVTADRMRSVLRSVSLMTSSLRMTVQLQSVTVTLWSRYV